ncbi:MAG: dUTP diphosphatase [Oscillospiraceae bacterium]|nr:dUTP diphosphatase [Oscillospiraceae bacterium]
MKPTVKIRRLTDTAVLPKYASPGAAGADIYADTAESVSFNPGETKLIRTGLAMAIPEGYMGLVFARSGLSSKRDLAPANKVGVIDSDYRGEVMVALHNHGSVTRTIEAGERIAQLVIVPCVAAELCEAVELDETERGTGGFGSTGKL